MPREKQVFDTNEIAHLWAHKTQSGARNKQGNFYFDGDTIYSYGSHFPIARHVESKKGPAVLFTDRSYSNTTAKHVNYVDRAIPGNVATFKCSRPDADVKKISQDKEKHARGLIAELNAIAKHLARVKPTYPAWVKGKVTIDYRANTYGAVSERVDVDALLGKRLAIHQQPNAKTWSVVHIVSGLAAATGLTWEQARYMLNKLDRLKAWDGIGTDGKIPDASKGELMGAVNKARSSAPGEVNTHPATVTKTWESAQSAVSDVNTFNEHFGFKARVSMPELPGVKAIVEKYQGGAQERAERAQQAARTRRSNWNAAWDARDTERQAERETREREAANNNAHEIITNWINGAQVDAHRLQSLPVAMKVEGENIVTSLGARFPVEHARKALPLIRKVWESGKEFVSNGHTIRLGFYTVDRVDDEKVVAGCHVVSRLEVERIAGMIEG